MIGRSASTIVDFTLRRSTALSQMASHGSGSSLVPVSGG